VQPTVGADTERFNPENGGSTMLVLSRKSRESVVVGGADGFQHVLRITVLEISGGKVKLGFDVDAGIPVHREEVWQRIRAHGLADKQRRRRRFFCQSHEGRRTDAQKNETRRGSSGGSSGSDSGFGIQSPRPFIRHHLPCHLLVRFGQARVAGSDSGFGIQSPRPFIRHHLPCHLLVRFGQTLLRQSQPSVRLGPRDGGSRRFRGAVEYVAI
jgi:carbon storage regulator CsrA